MKKITASFHREMEEKFPKTKTIKVLVEGEEYSIVLKNILSLQEKAELLKEAIDLSNLDIELSEITGGTLLLMLIYKALTDIEFPEEIQEQVAQFTWLLETGILKEVAENLKTGMVEEISQFLVLSMDQVTKMANKEIELKKKEVVE